MKVEFLRAFLSRKRSSRANDHIPSSPASKSDHSISRMRVQLSVVLMEYVHILSIRLGQEEKGENERGQKVFLHVSLTI